MNFEQFPNQGSPAQEQGKESVDRRVFRIGEKEYHVGDKVTVVRPDGTIENDWELRMAGGKFAVAEKIDPTEGTLSRKLIPVEEFQDQQTINEKMDARAKEFATPSGKQMNISPETIAQRFGIDTRGKTLQQIDEEVTRKIRE